MPAPDERAPAASGGRGAIAIALAFLIALAAIAWGYLGGRPPAAPASAPAAQAVPAPTPAPVPEPAAAPLPPTPPPAPVTAAAPAEAPGADTQQVRGVVKARDEVLFSSKIAARIAQMPYKEGQRFAKGDLLVGFDCTRLRAEIQAAWAANRATRQLLAQSEELDRYAAIGKGEVKVARAKAEQTGAEAGALEAQLRDCTIAAPFSGIVVEAIAHPHENAAPGKELLKVLNDEELEIHLIAPSAWLAWMAPGGSFDFRVDETGRTHPARIARLGAAVDPVSQTVRVIGAFSAGREAILPGMSGSAQFAPRKPQAPDRREAGTG